MPRKPSDRGKAQGRKRKKGKLRTRVNRKTMVPVKRETDATPNHDSALTPPTVDTSVTAADSDDTIVITDTSEEVVHELQPEPQRVIHVPVAIQAPAVKLDVRPHMHDLLVREHLMGLPPEPQHRYPGGYLGGYPPPGYARPWTFPPPPPAHITWAGYAPWEPCGVNEHSSQILPHSTPTPIETDTSVNTSTTSVGPTPGDSHLLRLRQLADVASARDDQPGPQMQTVTNGEQDAEDTLMVMEVDQSGVSGNVSKRKTVYEEPTPPASDPSTVILDTWILSKSCRVKEPHDNVIELLSAQNARIRPWQGRNLRTDITFEFPPRTYAEIRASRKILVRYPALRIDTTIIPVIPMGRGLEVRVSNCSDQVLYINMGEVLADMIILRILKPKFNIHRTNKNNGNPLNQTVMNQYYAVEPMTAGQTH